MFGVFKKKENITLYAPVTGKTIAITQVPDKVFSEKMMGDGIGFQFEDSVVYAPCDGIITLVAHTSHAVGITAKNGAEILIHIGLDTVNLNGQGLHALVQTGDKVKKGTPLIEIDRAFMKEQGIDLTTPMVVTNTSEYKMTIEDAGGHVIMGEDKVISFD